MGFKCLIGRYPASPKRQSGAAMVEFAIVVPVLLIVALGLVSAGAAWNHKLALTHSAREAGRYGATLPVTNFSSDPVPMNSWLDAVTVRALDEATGSLDPGTPGYFVCVAYVHPNGTSAVDLTQRRVESPEGSIAYDSGQCFADGRPDDERRVQVRVGRDIDFFAFVFTQTVSLSEDAVNRFEATFLSS